MAGKRPFKQSLLIDPIILQVLNCNVFFLGIEIRGSLYNDRDEGLDEFKEDKSDNGRINLHPTVKPTLLMQYLIRLVCPKGATILDPFMGSGSTGKAIEYENKERNADYKFIGIELDPIYCKIAAARIKYVKGAK